MSLAPIHKISDTKEFSVSQLSSLIRKTIDDNFGFITVRGEVSNLKVAASGHAYFNLKDNDAVLACTCWKPNFMRLNFKMEDGLEVLVSGRLSTYAGMSRYQLSAEKIDPAGSGALMELLNRRKEQFKKEGLFDEIHKKPIPFFSPKIGVITSPVGSVIEDIIHRIKDRFPVDLLLWPVAVQGEKCKDEVAAAINGFNNMQDSEKPEVIIIARGGGSIEDLWGFNEEEVVRAAFASKIPIISAIGHETDFTLLDFVADKRAPTPTAAAEFATPLKTDIENKIKENDLRARNSISNLLKNLYQKIDLVSTKVKTTERVFFEKQQKLDELALRLEGSLPNHLKLKLSKLESIKLPQSALANLIKDKETRIENLFYSSKIFTDRIFDNLNAKFTMSSKLIDSMSIKKNLERGYAIIRDDNGSIIKSKSAGQNSNLSEIEWFDGKIKIEKIDAKN